MSVISGMDEVIAYIKTQDEKIKNLENFKKLVREELIVNMNARNYGVEDIHNGDMKIAIILKEKWDEEQEKIKNLETNEKVREELIVELKEENEDIKKQYKSMVSKCGGQATNKVKLQKKLVEKDEEIKKLKEENEKLMKEQYKLLDEKESLSTTFWTKNEELKKENKELKEENNELKNMKEDIIEVLQLDDDIDNDDIVDTIREYEDFTTTHIDEWDKHQNKEEEEEIEEQFANTTFIIK